jgi:thiamine pyrophosphokinase
MKCVSAISQKESEEGKGVCFHVPLEPEFVLIPMLQQYDIIVLGGLSGRLDQTIHTLSYLHKLRKSRDRVFAVTDDNVGWVLDEVCQFFENLDG